MNNVTKFNRCANCGACYNVCPVNAISVIEQNNFYSVEVNDKMCISCGKCLEVCPVNSSQSVKPLLAAYGGRSTDTETIKISSSGGVFSAIAEHILLLGGVVYGAAYSDDHKCVMIKGTNEVSLDSLRKSKYVESLVGDSFRLVRENLAKGKSILFCGTPCQVAGLKKYLKNDYEGLFTCDFSCGGLPSHHVYKQYIDLLEKKYRSKVTKVDFRPKTYGWSTHSITVDFESGKTYNSLACLDPYFQGFIGKHFTVRDECLQCKFNNNHYSDIILADFWLYKRMSDFSDNEEGLSLIITNSEKGNNILNLIKDRVELLELDLEAASYNIKEYSFSKEFLVQREAFLKLYREKGLDVAAKAFYLPNKPGQIKIKIKYFLKNILRKFKLK